MTRTYGGASCAADMANISAVDAENEKRTTAAAFWREVYAILRKPGTPQG